VRRGDFIDIRCYSQLAGGFDGAAYCTGAELACGLFIGVEDGITAKYSERCTIAIEAQFPGRDATRQRGIGVSWSAGPESCASASIKCVVHAKSPSGSTSCCSFAQLAIHTRQTAHGAGRRSCLVMWNFNGSF
jgi:hypothetical protein